MNRLRALFDRASGREARELEAQLLAVALRARELERELDAVREGRERADASSPASHRWVRWVPAAVIVVTLAVLFVLGGRAFGVFADEVDASPAEDLGSFNVRVETAPGVDHPPLLVTRNTRWQGANSFQVQFDVSGPSWSFGQAVEASRVIVAAPTELLDWVCMPMVTATADDGTSSYSHSESSQGSMLSNGDPMTATMQTRLNTSSATAGDSLAQVLSWEGATLHRTVDSSEYLQNGSGVQRLVGVECFETKEGAAFEPRQSNAAWVEWASTHFARIDPALEDGSLRRWRVPGVQASTTDSSASRSETSFVFPANWSLLAGETGDLSVNATSISGCAAERLCRDEYSGTAYSWVFQDAIALQAEQQRASGASLVFSVLAGFVLSEAAGKIRGGGRKRHVS